MSRQVPVEGPDRDGWELLCGDARRAAAALTEAGALVRVDRAAGRVIVANEARTRTASFRLPGDAMPLAAVPCLLQLLGIAPKS